MMYLIWSNEHRAWWRGNRHGYTTRTDRAGQFSFEEARTICENANRYDQPLDKRPSTGINEVMVEAPSQDRIKLDLAFDF